MARIKVDGKPRLGAKANDKDKLIAAMALAGQQAVDMWDDDPWRKEVATEITQQILWGFAHENLIGYVANVHNAGPTDRITIKETRGLQAYWVADGGRVLYSRLTDRITEMTRDKVGFALFELIEDMENNFAENAADVISLGIQTLDAAFNARMLDLYQTAIPDNTSPYYVEGAGVALPAVNTALTEVKDKSRSNQITILGRATMTDQLQDQLLASGWFVPETNEAIVDRGVLGRYRGATVIELKNYEDSDDVPYIPGNELFVVAADSAEVGFFGGLRAQEWNEEGGDYWHYHATRRAGFMLTHPEYVRRIVDTEIDASI